MLAKHIVRSDDLTIDIFPVRFIHIQCIVSLITFSLIITALLTEEWLIGSHIHIGLNSGYSGNDIMNVYDVCKSGSQWACDVVKACRVCNICMWIATSLYCISSGVLFSFSQNKVLRVYLKHVSVDTIHKLIIGAWVVTSLLYFMGLLNFTRIAPSHIQSEMIKYEASFGLSVMCTFIVFTQCILLYCVAFSKLNMGMIQEAIYEFRCSAGVTRMLYVIFIFQIMCIYPFLITGFEWNPVISFFGIHWLDTHKTNIYSVYMALTSISLLVDMLKICMMPDARYDTIGDSFANGLYVFYMISKCIALCGAYIKHNLDSIDTTTQSDPDVHKSPEECESPTNSGSEWSRNGGDFIVE